MYQVRPVSKKSEAGYLQVGVETYGSGIWHSWFDRDLSLAGRVVVAHQDGSFQSKLIKVDRPILRIPTLAIHRTYPLYYWYVDSLLLVDRNVDTSFKFNQETEFVPILGLIESQLNSDTKKPDTSIASSIQENHHPALLSILANELSVAPEVIHDFEVYVYPCFVSSSLSLSVRHLYDTQPSVLGGTNYEFIFSPRLDNMFSS